MFIRLVVYVDQFVARVQGGEIGGTPSGMSGAIYDTVSVMRLSFSISCCYRYSKSRIECETRVFASLINII